MFDDRLRGTFWSPQKKTKKNKWQDGEIWKKHMLVAISLLETQVDWGYERKQWAKTWFHWKNEERWCEFWNQRHPPPKAVKLMAGQPTLPPTGTIP